MNVSEMMEWTLGICLSILLIACVIGIIIAFYKLLK